MGPEIGHFCPQNKVFGHFLQNRASEFYDTRSETVDNDFKSFNGSFVSGKILVLAILALFGQKYIACGDKMGCLASFGQFLPIC